MPEGDTIHRIAASLAPRLTGKALERVTTQGLARDVAGQTVMHVAAHGKHLVIELDSGAYLRAHLGMNGRFRAYNRAGGEAMLAKLWIGAPTIEISHRRHPRHGMAMATLGPDVLAGDFDGRIAAARAAEQGARSIADILLDQRIVAGIGNIYKCEALFVAGIDPRTRVGQLDAATLEEIYAGARRLMRAKLGPAGSRPAPSFLVYSRTGKPCTRCGTPISCYMFGDPARWTWSCATCQPAPARSGQ